MASIIGTNGPDTLNGTSANDTITGLAGNDLIEASLGTDVVDGGEGQDTLNISPTFLNSLQNGNYFNSYLTFTADRVSAGGTSVTTQLTGIEAVNVIERSGKGTSIDTGNSRLTFNIELGRGDSRVRGQAGAANETVTVFFSDTSERIIVSDRVLRPSDPDNIIVFQFENRVTPRTMVDTTAVESIIIRSLDQTKGLTFNSDIMADTSTSISINATDYTDLITGGSERLTIFVRGSANDADIYLGGGGADTFAIGDVSKIGVNGQITDFESVDTISIASPSAGAITPVFIGMSSFSGIAGEVRYQFRDSTTIIQADSDGDKVADQFLTIANGRFDLKETAPGQIQGTFLSAGINTITGTNGADRLTGTADADVVNSLAGNDTINGGSGNDTIDGGTGADIMNGGPGDDVFYIDSSPGYDRIQGRALGDRVNGEDGYDIAITSVDIGDSVGTEEVRAARGFAPINIIVDPGQVAVGNDGDNIFNIDGTPIRSGTVYEGGRGNDQYVVLNSFLSIVERAGEGNDTVFLNNTRQTFFIFTGTGSGANGVVGETLTFDSYALASDVEIETLSTASNAATSTISLTGNAFSQVIVGDYGDNRLAGGGVASGGGDVLIGLRGNDTYVVDATKLFIYENANEGNDIAIVTAAATNFVLNEKTSVEALQAAAGTDAINITGNPDAQIIIGNEGANILSGAGGGDTLVGLGGNDTYQVRSMGDQVIEANGGGVDTVFATVSYSLGANEVEVLSTVVNAATDPINLIGNYATQLVIGNYGNNVLNGGSGGVDTLIGLVGDDTYAVGDARVTIVESAGQGTDTVVASVSYQLRSGVSVETLAAQNRAGTEALVLTGNETAQVVAGNEGANTIDGRGGADLLVGGGGADVFAFTTPPASGNVDTILDFQAGVDRIGLATDVFAGVTDGGILTGEFVVGTAAQDGDDRLVYDQASGRLSYDADGNGAGAAVAFAQLAAGTALSAASFVAIAPVSELAA